MRRAALCAVALIISLPPLTCSQAESVRMGGGEGEGRKETPGNFDSIFSESSPNPCGYRRCPKGSVCVPVVNELLQLPIAHCQVEEGKERDAPCFSSLAGVSVVSCRSEAEWRIAGRSKCAAMGRAHRSVGVEVHHPCHRRNVSTPLIFLQATLTCCPLQNPPTNKPPPTSTEATSTATEASPTSTKAPPTSTEATPTTGSHLTDPTTGYNQVEEEQEVEEDKEEEDKEEEKEDKEEGHSSSRTVGGMFIAMTMGVVVLLMAVLVIVKVVRWRKRRRRSPYKPQLQFVTSYVNPCSEGSVLEEGKCEGGGVRSVKWDSSYVVTNHGSLTDTY